MDTTCKFVADIVRLFLLILTVKFAGDTASPKAHCPASRYIVITSNRSELVKTRNLQRRVEENVLPAL